MRDYSTARGLFGFMGFIGWTAVIVGIIVAMIGGAGGSSFGRDVGPLAAVLAAIPGLILALSGFLIVAFVKIGRAGIDTAENTQQTLAVNREHLEIFKTHYPASGGTRVGFGAVGGSPLGLKSTDVMSSSMPTSTAKGEANSVGVYGRAIETSNPSAPSTGVGDQIVEPLDYLGKSIRYAEGGFYVGKARFEDIQKAKLFVDQLSIKAAQISSN